MSFFSRSRKPLPVTEEELFAAIAAARRADVQAAYAEGANDVAQALHMTFRDAGDAQSDSTVRALTRSHSFQEDDPGAERAAHEELARLLARLDVRLDSLELPDFRELLGAQQNSANQRRLAELGRHGTQTS